jgi:hypothetical protein
MRGEMYPGFVTCAPYGATHAAIGRLAAQRRYVAHTTRRLPRIPIVAAFTQKIAE